MSKELPYFKFFPSEWLMGDISDEKDNIQGQFIRTCALYWNKNCKLTMDKLYKKVHKTKVNCLLNKGFISEKDGNVSISFLDEQYAELTDLQRKRIEAGRLGGEASVKQRLSKKQPKVKHLDIDKEEDKKRKDNIPALKEFLNYAIIVCKKANLNYNEFQFAIESKYETWVQDGWKDGNGKIIKNWKTKFSNTLTHLKPIRKYLTENTEVPDMDTN